MRHISGFYSLKSGLLTDFSSGAETYEDASSLERRLGRHQTLHLKLVYDKGKRTLDISQGSATYPLPLYYTVKGDCLYYSTSLKILLLHSGIPRAFDNAGLDQFLTYGHITGSGTLVRNVNKIEPFKILTAKMERVEQLPARYSVPAVGEAEAREDWNKVLRDAVRHCFTGEKEINLALSSGYDSNYILYVASGNDALPVNAFSVGAGSGDDELPMVKANIAEYDNVRLHTARTDRETLSCLPDIVWRLEGAVYERGVFLQYELARLAAREGKSYLICGECADQVMNQRYWDEDFLADPETGETLSSRAFPYLFGTNMVLKKSGIMANTFGIDSRYPYLDDGFIPLARTLCRLNGSDKQFHKANCTGTLPPAIVRNISKKGGATDVRALFGSEEEIKCFQSVIRRTGFYKAHHTETAASLRQLVHNVFRSTPDEVRKRKETVLRRHVGYAYLILFRELLLSGRYDYLSATDGIDMRLEDFLPDLSS